MTSPAVDSRPSGAAAAAPAAREPRVPALDGVRGLAIIVVLINNVYPGAMSLTGVDALVWHATNFGYVGVDLFFVLSGFLITGILYDTKGGDHFFRNFYIRRFLRIFPLYYGVLFVLYFIAPYAVHQRAETLALLSRFKWFEWTYLSNFGYLVLGQPPFNTVHFWSLAVEEQFYFVWPFVVFLLDRRRLIALCAAVIGAAFALRVYGLAHDWSVWAITMLTPLKLDTLATGALIALVMRGPNGLEPLEVRAGRVLEVCAPVALVLIGWNEVTRHAPGSTLMYSVGFTAVALGFGAMLVQVLGAEPGRRSRRFFEHPVMRFFGRYSYAMYIFHEIVLAAFAALIPWVAHPRPIYGSVIPESIAATALVCGVTVAMSVASWHLYEKQFLKLKRFVPYDREVRQDRGIEPATSRAVSA